MTESPKPRITDARKPLVLQSNLGCVDDSAESSFGISESHANEINHRILDVLVNVLSMKNRAHLLENNFPTIVMDAIKQSIERPTKRQRVCYSVNKMARQKSLIDCAFGALSNIVVYLPQR